MEHLLAEPRPGILLIQPTELVSQDYTFSLKLRDPKEGYVVLKFLFTKLYAREEAISEFEEVIIDLTLLYLEENRNFHHQRSSKTDLSKLSILSLGRFWREYRLTPRPSYVNASIAIFIKNRKLFSPRSFRGVEQSLDLRALLRRRNQKLASSPPPQRRIGVGYRDKGTAAIDHIDASPSWQEVAAQTAKHDINLKFIPEKTDFELNPVLEILSIPRRF